MLKRLLGLNDTEQLTAMELLLRHGWIWAVALLAAAAVFAIYCYRTERAFSRPKRLLVGATQSLAMGLLAILLLEPGAALHLARLAPRTLLVVVDTSQSMGIADDRVADADWAEAAVLAGKLPFDQKPAPAQVARAREEVKNLSRLELAKAVLNHPQWKLRERLGERHEIRCFSFGGELEPVAGKGEGAQWINSLSAEGTASSVGTAIEEAAGRYVGNPLAGVIVLSDFAWNKGEDPLAVSRQFKQRGIPVYTIPLGLPAPPDVCAKRLIAPDVVFAEDRVPLRVQVESVGYEGQEAAMSLWVDGLSVQDKKITLAGGIQFEEFEWRPAKPATSRAASKIEIRIAPLANEVTDQNNSIAQTVMVIDEKINVLYVEGMPRWEYRYLRWVLLRDPRLNVHFVMTMGDPDLPAVSPQYYPRFPEDPRFAYQFDLVILGDVPSSFLTPEQMQRIEELVKTQGGSLLMLSGRVANPHTYVGTPLANLLPVDLGAGEWMYAPPDVCPTVPAQAAHSQIVVLAQPQAANDSLWQRVRPLNRLPKLSGVKKGAEVLLGLSKGFGRGTDETYPLVSWQRYGTGKCMFVASDNMWRLRMYEGDRYHARFWGQAIQFLTLSRKLGQDKRVSLEVDRKTYALGDSVHIFVNRLSEGYEPIREDSYTVSIAPKEGGEEAQVLLTPQPERPGLYGGTFLPGRDGQYVLKAAAQDQSASTPVDFIVEKTSPEFRDTGMHRKVAEGIASLSGGRCFGAGSLNTLPDVIGVDVPTQNVQVERDIWDVPLIFVVIVVLLGTEWLLRRNADLV